MTGQVVVRRYPGGSRDEAEREWRALSLLARHAPRLAPSGSGRGYVLRRLLRRLCLAGVLTEQDYRFLHETHGLPRVLVTDVAARLETGG